LAVNVGTAGAFVVNGGALGTPSSGTVTNLTGTASININGTVGATTANTGSFTSLAYSTTLTGGTGIVNLGSGQFYKDASGLVGIGQTTPISFLDIYGSGAYTYSRYWRSDQAGYGARFGTADTLMGSAPTRSAGVDGFSAIVFGIAGTEKARFDSSGNLGIGTTTPTVKLDVIGAINASTGIFGGTF